MNTPSTAHESLLNSKTYKGDNWFSVVDIAKEIKITQEMAHAVLKLLLDSGIVTKKRVKRTSSGGTTFQWRRRTLTPRDFFGMSFRRHTNEELGCGSTYLGRYYA